MWLSKHGFQVLELISFNVKAGVFSFVVRHVLGIFFRSTRRRVSSRVLPEYSDWRHSRGAIRFLINVGISRGCSSEVVSQGYVVTNDYKTLMGVVTLLAAVVPGFISTLLRIEVVGVLWPLRETPRCSRNSHFYHRPLKRRTRPPPCVLKHPQSRSALVWPSQSRSRSPLFNSGSVELC